MKKIKILRIIARLNIGGPAIHAVLLAQGLDKTRFTSLLVCGSIGRNEGDMSYYAAEKNVKPYFIPELKRELNFFYDIVAFNKIYNIIKSEQPDIIHTHTAKAGTLGRLPGILYNLLHPSNNKRIRLVHTFHGHIFHGYFNKFKTKVFIYIEKFLALFTCEIITVSESVKKDLVSLRICREDKIKVIPLGFELEKFFDIQPKNSNVLDIGIIGRLVPIKNHRLFLDATARIIKEKPKAKLRFKIIGDGRLRKELEAYSHKLNISRLVNFLGWQKDLVKVYSDLDIVALTSINEGTPVSLIEAMVSGKAVIATDVGGVRDLLGQEINMDMNYPNGNFKILERGIIVNPANCDSFVSALAFLLEQNELRRNMGMRSRDFIRKRFTKDRLIKNIENLYDSILSSWKFKE